MNIQKDNYESYMVDYLEGNLSAQEEQTLHTFLLQHPELQTDLEMFKLTILEPDTSIVFDNKDVLKKHESKIISLFTVVKYTSVIAAICLLFIAIRWVALSDEVQTTGVQYSQDEMTKPIFDKVIQNTTDTFQNISPLTPGPNNVFLADDYIPQNKQSKKESIENNNPLQMENSNINELVASEITLKSSIQISGKVHQPKLRKEGFETLYAQIHNVDFNKMMQPAASQQHPLFAVLDKVNETRSFAQDVMDLLVKNTNTETEKAPNTSNVKTTSIKILGLEYYSRRKSTH